MWLICNQSMRNFRFVYTKAHLYLQNSIEKYSRSMKTMNLYLITINEETIGVI